MLSITDFKKYNSPEHYVITEHARIRLYERGIRISDIQNAIANGEIIRQYEDDKPFPSCLLLYFSESKKPLHVVVSLNEEFIYLITAYWPDSSIWESDYKTKKEVT